MCEEISSRISSLLVENDEARLLKVGVRPSSSLQQAPWWVKIPKRFTWLNLPDGVTDDQRDKDFAKMGITREYHSHDPIGIRTPSPDLPPRKRRRRHSEFDDKKRPRREEYISAEYDDFENRYPHLSGPPSAGLQRFQEIQVQNEGGPVGSLDVLLQVVEDDMRTQLEAPPLPPLPPPPPPPPPPRLLPPMRYQNHPEPFDHMPYQFYAQEFKAPLLPRPKM